MVATARFGGGGRAAARGSGDRPWPGLVRGAWARARAVGHGRARPSAVQGVRELDGGPVRRQVAAGGSGAARDGAEREGGGRDHGRERREGSSQGSSRARAVGLGEEDVDGARWGGSPARRLRRRAAGRRRASSSGIDPI